MKTDSDSLVGILGTLNLYGVAGFLRRQILFDSYLMGWLNGFGYRLRPYLKK